MSDQVENQSSWNTFRGDLSEALAVWRKATPAVPIITFLVAAAPVAIIFFFRFAADPCIQQGSCPPSQIGSRILVATLGNLAGLVLSVLLIGWVGTERMWYLRAFRQLEISARELWRFTWTFLGRYFTLGLLVSIVAVPTYLLIFMLAFRSEAASGRSGASRITVVVLASILSLVIDFLLTFVTPALAYSTKRVFTALQMGTGMIRAYWPATAWYVVVPPLAVLLLVRAVPIGDLGVSARVVLVSLAALLNLWFKGATAAFYLRRNAVGDDGAALPRDKLTPSSKSAPEASAQPPASPP